MNTNSHQLRANPVSEVGGVVTVPGDKSISHRALMLCSLANGRSTLRHFLRADDCLSTMAAMRKLGVQIEEHDDIVRIDGVGLWGLQSPSDALDFGNSGTGMRLLTGILAAQDFDSVLTGDKSLQARPMLRIAEPLCSMGARIRTTQGHAPLHIDGGTALHGIEYTMPIASAQVKSALLLAGIFADGATTVFSPGVSRDHTERMLEAMGVSIDHDVAGRAVTVLPTDHLQPFDLAVPGDFSSAAFFIVAACLASSASMKIPNVGLNHTRIGLLEILKSMGADIEVVDRVYEAAEPTADLIVRQSSLKGIDVPPELVALAIDEFPIVFVAAAGATGTTRVTGAEELRHKESDRIAVMATALSQLGVKLEETDDGIVIEGGGGLSGGVVDSCGDHRVAMSLAIASLLADEPIQIANTAQVATSFPNFVDAANAVGFDIRAQGDS